MSGELAHNQALLPQIIRSLQAHQTELAELKAQYDTMGVHGSAWQHTRRQVTDTLGLVVPIRAVGLYIGHADREATG